MPEQAVSEIEITPGYWMVSVPLEVQIKHLGGYIHPEALDNDPARQSQVVGMLLSEGVDPKYCQVLDWRYTSLDDELTFRVYLELRDPYWHDNLNTNDGSEE